MSESIDSILLEIQETINAASVNLSESESTVADGMLIIQCQLQLMMYRKLDDICKKLDEQDRLLPVKYSKRVY